MPTLTEIAAQPGKREQIVKDSVAALDAEVASKGGLGGVAIKTAYKMLKGLAPNMVTRVMDWLLDDFLVALQPFYDEAKSKNVDLVAHMDSRRAQIAEALLSVTDARAEKVEGGALKKGYQKLRPTAAKHVEAGVPRLAGVLAKHDPA